MNNPYVHTKALTDTNKSCMNTNVPVHTVLRLLEKAAVFFSLNIGAVLIVPVIITHEPVYSDRMTGFTYLYHRIDRMYFIFKPVFFILPYCKANFHLGTIKLS